MLDDGAFKPDLRRDADTFIDTLIRRALFHQRGGPWLIWQAARHIEAEIARQRMEEDAPLVGVEIVIAVEDFAGHRGAGGFASA